MNNDRLGKGYILHRDTRHRRHSPQCQYFHGVIYYPRFSDFFLVKKKPRCKNMSTLSANIFFPKKIWTENTRRVGRCRGARFSGKKQVLIFEFICTYVCHRHRCNSKLWMAEFPFISVCKGECVWECTIFLCVNVPRSRQQTRREGVELRWSWIKHLFNTSPSLPFSPREPFRMRGPGVAWYLRGPVFSRRQTGNRCVTFPHQGTHKVGTGKYTFSSGDYAS